MTDYLALPAAIAEQLELVKQLEAQRDGEIERVQIHQARLRQTNRELRTAKGQLTTLKQRAGD